MNQKEKILRCLSQKGYITQAIANGMDIKNLRARITELKGEGHQIGSEAQERIKFVNSKGQRHCQKYHVSKYILKLKHNQK